MAAIAVSCCAFSKVLPPHGGNCERESHYNSERTYEYDFAICAIFKNEAPYLKEWIEFHKIVGAKHFYLYNNQSEDHYLEVLKPYIDSCVVELVDWQDEDFLHRGQKMAYLDAIDKVKGKVKWLAIIDIDEYIVPKFKKTIPRILSSFEKDGVAGVGVNWQMFGTSSVPKISENELMVEKLVFKAPKYHSENIHVKSIVRPEYVVPPPHVHCFQYEEGYSCVNTLGEEFSGPFSPYITTAKLQINHYWTKDEDFFYRVKVARRMGWGEALEFIERRRDNLNSVKDRSIFRFLPLLRERVFGAKAKYE